VELYLREVHRQPPLSADEEAHLIGRMRAGDPGAREALVYRSLRLVPVVCRHFIGEGRRHLDLIEHGNLALLRAVEAYQSPGQSDPFCVHAAEQVRQALVTLVQPSAEAG